MYFIFTHVVAFLETQCYQRYHLRVKFWVKNRSKITINREKTLILNIANDRIYQFRIYLTSLNEKCF